MSQTVLIGASRSSFASFHSFGEWNPVRCHHFLRLFVLGWEPGVSSPACQRSCSCTTSVEPQRSRAPSDSLVPVASTNLIRNCTGGNSTVFFLDRRQRRQRRRSDHSFHGRNAVSEVGSHWSGLVLASHVPHDGTRVLASLKPTIGTVITTSPDCESTTWIILSTAASSRDSRRSRVAMLLAPARRLSSFSPDSLTCGR